MKTSYIWEEYQSVSTKKRPNFTIQIKTTEDKLRMPKLYEVQKQQQILPKIIAIQ